MPIKAILLDTETTGIKAPEILETAYIPLREISHYPDSALLNPMHPGQYQSYFKASKPSEPMALQIHGITQEKVKDYQKFSMEALAIPDTVEYLVCHNVGYDYRVLGKPEHLKKICTVKLAKRLWPELKSHKLALLIEEFFPSVHAQLTVNAHGAMVDTKLMLLVIHKALQEFEIDSWDDMYEIAGVK